jgi:hypothetical protein
MTIKLNAVAIAGLVAASTFFIGNGISFLIHDGAQSLYSLVSWCEVAAGALCMWHLAASYIAQYKKESRNS